MLVSNFAIFKERKIMIMSIIIGAIVGMIAGNIMKSHYSLLMNIIIGMAGSAVGHFLFGLIGFSAHGLAGIIVDIAGACLVIYLARKIA